MTYPIEFLYKLDQQQHKTIYSRITSLTNDELPQETIEGVFTQGSVSVDGSSAVRRTCSLTMVTNNTDFSDYYWTQQTKFRLEVGLSNMVDPDYPDIIWFDQGLYLITSFNKQLALNNCTITLQGKDKMCKLNGDLGGNINASTDFGKIEEEDANHNWVIRSLPLKEIILNLVHVYGGEPLHNIIINDLDTAGLELLEYRSDRPMYLYREEGSNRYINNTFDGSMKVSLNSDMTNSTTLENLSVECFETLVDSLTETAKSTPIYVEENKYYYFTKIEYGNTSGYRLTELTYAGDLIANVGETITSVLDKIKNMLGHFEYFYNKKGQFVFQKKKSVINTTWSPTESFSQRFEEGEFDTVQYKFNELQLITAFSANPNLTNFKNDFSVWGKRKSITGAEIPVHLRYAIDEKPVYYKSIDVGNDQQEIIDYNQKYGTNLSGQVGAEYKDSEYDWRELIYRMALDYFKYAHVLDDFPQKVAAANPLYYPTGTTGYEQYYTDLQAFWRELYNPEILPRNDIYISSREEKIKANEGFIAIYNETKIAKQNSYDALTDKTTSEAQKYLSDIEALEATIKSLQEENNTLQKEINKYEEGLGYYSQEESKERKYWNKSIYETPENLNFWFDFIDTGDLISKYSVKKIGSRTKVINDNNVKSIYYRDIPQVIYTSSSDFEIDNQYMTGYRYIQIPQAYQDKLFSISSQGLSAKERLDELLQTHTYFVDSSNITTFPLYHLEPNSKIRLESDKYQIYGDYEVSKFTIPLTYNGTMSLSVTKSVN